MKKLLFIIALSSFFVSCENSVTHDRSDDVLQPDNNETQDEETKDDAVDEIVLDEETVDKEQPDETQDETVDSDIIWDNCSESYDCEVGELCQKKIGDCNGWGHCEKVPEECAAIYEPVCGCDDVTYPNICEANRLYKNAKYSGECE